MKLSSTHKCKWGAKLLSVMLLLCIAVMANAQQAPALFTSANSLYKANNFAQAGTAYEKLLAEGYKDATVYYNLGNCYYKQNQLGKAIVNYERAYKLLPDDEDIAYNLKLANAHLVDKIQPVPQLGIVSSWNNFVSSHSSKAWGWMALAAVWFAFIALALYLFNAAKKLSGSLGVLSLSLSVFFIALAFARYNAETNSGEAVLMVNNSYIKSAPDDNGTNVFMLHEGVKFSMLDNVGNWYKIRLADGKVGWIEKTHFEKI